MIEISEEAIRKVEKFLEAVPGGAQKAMSAALNRGLSRIKTVVSDEVRKVYTAPASEFSKSSNVRIGRASAENLAGYVHYSGHKIPLYKFQVSPETPNSGKPIHALVKRGEGGVLPHGFVARLGGGHIGVFQRIGNPSFPIEEKMGLAMAQMVANAEVVKVAEKEAQETVEKRIEHEIDRILNGYGGQL